MALESSEWGSQISASGSLNLRCISYQRQQYFIHFNLQIVCNILIQSGGKQGRSVVGDEGTQVEVRLNCV